MNLTLKTGEKKKEPKKICFEGNGKKKKNQGTNPSKARIHIRLNYNLSAYLLQNIMIIVYAPCITGLELVWVAR